MSRSASPTDAPVWTQRLMLVVVVSSMVRLVVASTTGLGVDESYAVTVARPLAWSYFDHPPLHFWMAGFMTWLTGDTQPLAVRLPFIGAFSVTLWAIGRLGQLAFGPRAGMLGALALACTGVLGLTTGSWVLPDGPLVMCAALAAWLLAPIMFVDEATRKEEIASPTSSPVLVRWVLTGVLLGASLLSKYHAVLYGAGLLIFLLTTENGRRQLRGPGPWVAAAIAVLCTGPVIWWNAQHGWASFAFQSARAEPNADWSIAPFLENLTGQAAWLLPWMAIPFAMAFWRALRTGPRDAAQWFFVSLAFFPIVGFTLITLGGARGLPHWQAPGWVFVAPLVGRMLDRAFVQGRRWPHQWLIAAPVAWCLLVALLGSHVATGWLGDYVPALRTPKDPTLDAFDWRALRDSLSSRGIAIDAGVAARSWIQAGKLGVALGPDQIIACACDDPHHFAFRYRVRPSPAVVIEHAQPWSRSWRPASVALADRLGEMNLLDSIALERAGRPAVRLLVYRRRSPSAVLP